MASRVTPEDDLYTYHDTLVAARSSSTRMSIDSMGVYSLESNPNIFGDKNILYSSSSFFFNYEILITFSKYWISKNEIIMLTSMAKWINKSRFHANISRERICNTILGEKMVFYSRLNKRSRKYYANNFTRDWSSKIATGRSFLDRRFLTIHVSSEHMSVHQSFRKKRWFRRFPWSCIFVRTLFTCRLRND